jgi:hypothetical protein
MLNMKQGRRSAMTQMSQPVKKKLNSCILRHLNSATLLRTQLQEKSASRTPRKPTKLLLNNVLVKKKHKLSIKS